MEPLGKLNAHFPTVTEHINKRNKKVRNRIPARPTDTPPRLIFLSQHPGSTIANNPCQMSIFTHFSSAFVLLVLTGDLF